MSDRDRGQPLSEHEQMLVAGFVLGDLTTEETAQLKQLAAINPKIRQEIRAMQASLELMPQALAPLAPPPHLRQRVVESELVPVAAPISMPVPVAVSTSATVSGLSNPEPVTARNSPFSRRARSILKLLAVVLAFITLLLAADNLRLRSQLRLAETRNLDRVADILQQPTSRTISLVGNSNEATGTLLFTPGNWSEVIVSLGNLPPLPPDRIYRMWLALDNGDAILCGEFNTEGDGSVFIRFTPPESPSEGVKATELYVTQEELESIPMPQAERVMEGEV